jgi:hypothetical protein
MFRTVPLSIISSFPLYTQHIQQWCIYIYIHIPLLCVQWKTPDDGQRNCPKHIEFYSKIKIKWYIYIYHCCVYSGKLLMMDKGTVRNM